MNRDEAGEVVRALVAGFPGTPTTEDSLAKWAEKLAPIAAPVAMACADTWVGTEDRFPTLAAFLHACEHLTQVWAEEAASQTRDRIGPPADAYSTGHEVKVRVQLLKDLEDAVRRGDVRGVDAEETFRRWCVEEGVPIRDVAVSPCRECDGTGWRWIVGEGQDGDSAIPCSACRPTDHDYHRDGHFDVGHPTYSCSHPRCQVRSKRTKGAGRR